MYRFPRLNEAFARLTIVFCTSGLLCAGGCKTADRGSDLSPVSDPAIVAQLEKDYVIGPATAPDLNYRVAWQHPTGGTGVRHFSVQGDSVYLLDGHNFLTRIKIDDGARLWRTAVAEPIDEIQGVNMIGSTVYVTADGAVLVFDGANGSQIGRQKLARVASTPPRQFGPFLLYGSRNGQLIWFSTDIGFPWRGYQIANSIGIPPLIIDEHVIVIGDEGIITALNASTASRYWSKKLLDEVVAAPAAGEGAVYVAGQDQYLWAFDISDGRTLWKYLADSPLAHPPTLIGDRVYQQIAGRGLACFAALPPDTPGGQQLWMTPGLKGNVIMQHGSELWAWDHPSKQMTLADATRGAVSKTIALPQVRELVVTTQEKGDLYAVSYDGRVVRLVPRN